MFTKECFLIFSLKFKMYFRKYKILLYIRNELEIFLDLKVLNYNLLILKIKK